MSELFETILELEMRHTKPEVRVDPAELDKLVADDFFEIGSSGKFFYKSDCMVEGGIEPFDVTMSNFQLHPVAEDAVLTTYRIEDRTRGRNTLRSSIWKRIDGRWQLFFHTGTIEQSSTSV